MVRAHIYYSGTVQGVGFRYTAQRLATDLGLTGWVRNLSDGRVEIAVEGPKEKIQSFANSLDDHFRTYIDSMQMDFLKPDGAFQDFSIKMSH